MRSRRGQRLRSFKAKVGQPLVAEYSARLGRGHAHRQGARPERRYQLTPTFEPQVSSLSPLNKSAPSLSALAKVNPGSASSPWLPRT